MKSLSCEMLSKAAHNFIDAIKIFYQVMLAVKSCDTVAAVKSKNQLRNRTLSSSRVFSIRMVPTYQVFLEQIVLVTVQLDK